MKLLALDGDGISPEILEATLRVIEALSLDLEIEKADVGFKALEKEGTTISEALVEKAKAADGIILGPVSHMEYPPVDQGGLNPSGVLRKNLDLFANIRPAKDYSGIERPVSSPLDLILVRENTEGFYADRTMVAGTGEFMPTEDLALAVRKVSREGSRRIAEEAFRIAHETNRKVTAVHKANVLRLSDGLFLEEVRKVAHQYPNIDYKEMLVDAAAAHLVRNPSRFQVIVTTNMFGDILSDLASELAGGLGLAGSLNLGKDHAMAQAQHGSAPDIAGKDCANPTSLLLSTAMLFDWLGHKKGTDTLLRAAFKIRQAIAHCLADPETRTRDLKGSLGTRAFTLAVLSQINRSTLKNPA